MGNYSTFICQSKCFRNDNIKLVLSDNIQTDNSFQITKFSNEYINKDYLKYKSIEKFFNRHSTPIKNYEISITPNLANYLNIHDNNLYYVNELIANQTLIKKEMGTINDEKEIDLNKKSIKFNSTISHYSNLGNEKDKFKTCIKSGMKKINHMGFSKMNSIHMKHINNIEKDYHRKISNFKLKKELNDKDSVNVCDESPEGFLRKFTHTTNNLSMFKRKGTASTIFSNIENTVIIHHPKGYFHYKHLNYKYFGKSNENKNKNGFGIITYDDKSKVKGIFKNDKLNGFGKFIDLHSIYTGYYKDSIPNGFGIYKKDNVTTIGDNWIKNSLTGIGFQTSGLNNFYEGEFNNSVKEGIGIYHWNDNTICFGEWNDDKVNGYGVIKYANNNTYMGEFKENEMDGWGEFIWNDNKYYCGEYKDGFKHGFGIYVTDFKKINCYIGFWEYGQASGLGIKINDNDMIIGIWRDGKRINYIKYWEIKDYLKPNQTKYFKFLHRDIKFFKQFIMGLNEALIDTFNYKNIDREMNLTNIN